VSLVAGNFNIIHPGHLRVLHFARSCGDVLLIALYRDGCPGTLVPAEQRRSSLLALEAVDEVIEISEDELIGFISQVKPHFVVKGKEHENKHNPELDIVSAYGGHVLFSGGEERFSTRDLIRHELRHPAVPPLSHPRAFISEHGIQLASICQVIQNFSRKRVLVVGELIVDEYIHCEPIGMSQEEPTIVVSPVESNRYVGAAGIVSAHLAGLGAEVDFVTVVGDDLPARESHKRLTEFRVMPHFLYDETRPTILKQRFRTRGRSLLRVNHLSSHDIESQLQAAFFLKVLELIPAVDLLIFSDFNYGCLPQALVLKITAECHRRGIPFVADSQASSQVGNIGRFEGALLLSATEREMRLAMSDFKSGIQSVANELFKESGAKHLVVKLGQEGLIFLTKEGTFVTTSLPALNQNPVDVAGAGDALLAASSLAIVSDGSPFEAIFIGSVAAALQVGRQGNIPMSASEILSAATEAYAS
jgi:rfaE bifunctional protein kinase chain/domain